MEGPVGKAELVTPDELAAMTRLSKGKIYELAKKGAIPCIRIDSAIRFDPRDVRGFIMSHKQGGKERKGPPLVSLPKKKKG